ncbi:S24 family peptidase [Senegalimassilia anaerobia]|uniref:S24 family peptidase n=1 Tax=Senegalimassilia anaerobia TaxID=1473216 RepID=UPI00248DC768|nr:S24 family peptidase [Senegalimassilia anaerobia]
MFGYADGFYAKLHGLTDAPAGAIAAKPSSALVPLLGTTHMGEFEDEGECDRMVEVPASVAEAHPGGFCVRADGECMNNRYPSDSVLFVDPNMQPFDGCAVLAETQDFQSIVRKYSRGASSLMLSPDSHDCVFEDIIVRADDAPIMLKGVVVWYQAEKDVR